MLGKTGQGKRATEDKRLDGISNAMDMNLRKLQKMVRDGEAWHPAADGVTNNQIRLGT